MGWGLSQSIDTPGVVGQHHVSVGHTQPGRTKHETEDQTGGGHQPPGGWGRAHRHW